MVDDEIPLVMMDDEELGPSDDETATQTKIATARDLRTRARAQGRRRGRRQREQREDGENN